MEKLNWDKIVKRVKQALKGEKAPRVRLDASKKSGHYWIKHHEKAITFKVDKIGRVRFNKKVVNQA